MTDDTDPEPDHFFRDSSGHLWLDVTAIREGGGVTLYGIGGYEIFLEPDQFVYGTEHPELRLDLSEQDHDALDLPAE